MCYEWTADLCRDGLFCALAGKKSTVKNRKNLKRAPTLLRLAHFALFLLWPVLLLSASAAIAQSGHHKLQVSDAALAERIQSGGGRLIADYGAFKVLETSELKTEFATNSHVEIRDAHNRILLNAFWLDTTSTYTKALRTSAGSFTGKRMHLVQFAGPVKPEWRDELAASGVRIVSYIPHNTYLVYGDSPAIARVQSFAASAPHVQWDGAYAQSYRLHPAARQTDSSGDPREIGTDEFAIQLVADTDANTNTLALIDRLKLAPVQQQYHNLEFLNIVVRLAPGILAQIAAQPDVISIQPHFPRKRLCERQDQIVAGNLSGGVPSGPGYLTWLTNKGFAQAQFTASGFVVDLADSGVDDGTTSPNHLGLHTAGDLSQASRVAYARLIGTPNSGSTLAGCDGHGTLNAHIVGGYNALSTFPHLDSSGCHYGLGVCPFVLIGSSVVFDTNYTSPDFTTLLSRAYQDGARISNNSWGSAGGSADYDADAQTFDTLVRDAQPSGATYSADGNQEIVVVFSAGNDGPDSKTISAPGTAKNVITVGAAESVQPFGGQDRSGVTDSEADDANDILSFSSRGPCRDGRHKPDLVAPGSHVSGGVVQAANPATNGTAGSCFDGSGVSGGVNSPFFPSGQQFYTASSGTSHATPCVSGGCALIRQYFINNFTNPPSAAMTKAYLLNSARYLTGANAGDSLWSDTQGFGEMNLGMAFDGAARILRDQVSNDLFTASGQTRSFTGVVADTTKPFRVTLAWTDAPGSTTGSAYNNDLDLTVTIGGNTYKGNVFSGQYSVTGGSADTENNVESVFLPAGISGSFVVNVTAADINSDGVPNNGISLDQDFALVVYNAQPAASPVIKGVGASLLYESCPSTNGAVDPSETVTLNFSLQNTGSADTTNLTATLLASGGITSPSAAQTYGALTAGGSAVAQPFTFTATGNCGDTNVAAFQLQDGALDLGTITFNLPLGKIGYPLSESFDDVTAPALPATWSANISGSVPFWNTSTTAYDSYPNAAFATDSTNVGISELISPGIPIATTSARLSFQNKFDLESQAISFASMQRTNYYDGGVLEIDSGDGTYQDIVSAGGSFVSGGYVGTIYNSGGNPLAGCSAWSGSSGGFITTLVNLPAAAAGQTIRLKWRLGTDAGNYYGGTGWYIDSVTVADGFTCCISGVDLDVRQTSIPEPAIVGQDLTYLISVANRGSSNATGVTLTDVLPSGVTFVSTTLGTASSSVLNCPIGVLAAGGSTNISLVVRPDSGGTLTNVASVVSDAAESNTANNSSKLVSVAQASIWANLGSNHLGVFITGKGTVSPNYSNAVLVAGKSYSMTAKPAKGYILSNWMGGVFPVMKVLTEELKLTFKMTNGLSLYANFVTNPFVDIAGNYGGIFLDTNDLQPTSAGFLSAAVTTSGHFSSKVLLGGSSYSLSGGFSAGGYYSNSVARKGTTGMSVQLQLDLAGGLGGVLSDGKWNAPLSGYRAVYSSKNQAPWGGRRYTLGIPGSEDGVSAPGGWGYGLATVALAGGLKFAGVLPEGTRISQGTFVSAQGQWPFYASLASGKGVVLGWLTLSNLSGSDVSGLLNWVKLADSKAKLYNSGYAFTNGVEVTGSIYRFTSGVPALGLSSSAELVLTGGGLLQDFTNSISLGADNKFSAGSNVTLSLSSGSGIFRGKVVDGGDTIPCSGVVLQKQGVGNGYFLGTERSGGVLLK